MKNAGTIIAGIIMLASIISGGSGMRSTQSLRLLAPLDTLKMEFSTGGATPVLSIESDRLVDGQVIEYEGKQ